MLSLLSLLVYSTNAQSFRGFKWGTSKKEILAKEGEQIDSFLNSVSPNTLKYEDKIVAGNSCSTYFFFADGKGLVEGRYVMSLTETSPEKIISSLSAKYGKPSQLVNAHNTREYHWTNRDTKITFQAFPTHHAWLHYYSLSHWLFLKRKQKEKEQEGL